MPVIFRGKSEYDRNYRWNQSYRSASFSPNLEQSATDAGIRSDQIGSVNGPRITSKKKVWHRESQIQNCLSWCPESDADSQGQSVDSCAEVKEKGSPLIKAHKKLRSKKFSTVKTAKKQKENFAEISNLTSPKKSRSSQQKRLVNSTEKHKEAQKATTSPNVKNFPKKDVQNRESKNVPSKRVEKHIPSYEEFASKETDTSNHERNIPLEHRAGLKASKPARKSKARLSEYQRNFAAPKFIAKPSPILSAHDVVHTSSSAIPPHGGMRFDRLSEYVSKYGSPTNKRKQEQSTSSPASPSMKLKVKDIQKPFTTHHGKRAFRTEYSSQYEPNSPFSVGELRKMAEENKQKHEGTHIDPEHATQVISPFNKLWEVSSDGGTEISNVRDSVDKETKADQRNEKDDDSEEKWSKVSQKGSDSIEDITEDKSTVVEIDSLEERHSEISKSSIARKLAWTESADDTEELSQNSRESVSVLEGRVSTPRLQEIGGALRSHHDLTTPSVGGALLISPKYHKGTSLLGSECSTNHEDARMQIAGSPTYDSQSLLQGRLHHLVRSSPQPLVMKHTQSSSPPTKKQLAKTVSPQKSRPATQSAKTHKHVTRAPIRGSLRSEEFQHCGPTGRLHTAPSVLHRNDDALSVASSLTSARATELLHRATQRKSFWTTT